MSPLQNFLCAFSPASLFNCQHKPMSTSSLARQAVAHVIVMILLYSAAWGCQPAQQSKRTLAPAAPSPTWMLGSTGSWAVTPIPTSATGSNSGELAGAGRTISSREPIPPSPTPTPLPEVLHYGQRLFYELGCFHCHGVLAQGLEGPRIARTNMSLDAVTIQVYQPEGDMIAFSEKAVSRDDVAAIYAYLQSLQPPGPHPEIIPDQPDSATGEALYRYFGCFGCHGYQGEGGFGPHLAGTQLTLEELGAQVRKPRARMPAYSPERISNAELAHIYAFLQSVTP